MTATTWTICPPRSCAAALIAVSAELANAAPARVATNTNLRQGPGLNFGVIVTAPAGSVVNVIRCGVEWCNVTFAGRPGYMIARNLGMRGAPVARCRAWTRAGGRRRTRPGTITGPATMDRANYGPRRYWGWRRW